jgi:type II restriction/modification system DNA methylase subunit YeeA
MAVFHRLCCFRDQPANQMTPAEFKKKWSRYQGKETSGYAEHFNDLCRLLGQPTPAEADPSGSDFFCFQKRVIKDAELFDVEKPDASAPEERGFADVWKKDCFGWEYKGKKKNLDEAYKQLLRYREALLNPPLLVVCDFDRYIVKTNFNGTVQEVHEFTNDQIDRPENLRILRSLFTDPGFLKPQRTTDQVTKNLAAQIAEIAKSLQSRESVELADARSRKEVNVAQKKNLRIARFLNRIVFCFFAEDTGLLPKRLFTEIAKSGIGDPKLFAETLEKLFAVMATGGTFGKDKIRYFNGHLFEDATVFELTEDELRQLAEAGEADWQFIEPSIMGTLFERALDESQRSQLGAHYTSEADIKTLVEPVLMQPFRREWATLKGELAAAYAKGKGNAAQRERLAGFQKQLAAVTVLDPACGSGNFLYVSLQLLLGLEKEVITFATQLGFAFKPQVSVSQLKAIEINPYAFELAQVSVQIGYLEWRRDNGFDNDRTPVLQNLGGFQNEDALLVPHFRNKAKTLTEAQAGEHADDDALKFYTEREWPAADVIVGNPPFFLGRTRTALSKGEQVEKRKCERAGLLATQGIRGGANREVLSRIKNSGDIFYAVSDRDWILDGANVHVSMVGFDSGKETEKLLNGVKVANINPNLSATADITTAVTLPENLGVGFMGSSKKASFDIPESLALEMIRQPNPTGMPNSDVIRPWINGQDITRRWSEFWIIDFPPNTPLEKAAGYAAPFAYSETNIKPEREKNKRAVYRERWWIHAEPRPEMRANLVKCDRFVVTPTVSKHRIFDWQKHPFLPDQQLIAFARSDDYFFGIVNSRLHETWSLAQGTQVRERESGFRYTPTSCFENFPFPFADDLSSAVRRDIFVEPSAKNLSSAVGAAYSAPDGAKSKTKTSGYKDSAPDGAGLPRLSASAKSAVENRQSQKAAIAAAAKELNELRERWLNPPEWTVEKVLEFPGSASGPWARYIDQTTLHEVGRVTPCAPSGVNSVASVGNQRQAGDCPPYLVGTVRYPRLEPRDADCAAKLKDRTLTKLYNERPAWLDLAHRKLDAAVAAAYGWPADLTDEQILEKLLALNLARAAEEAKTSKVKKTKEQRGKATEEMI